MRGRFDAGGTQEGIEQVKEGVAAAPKPRVHLLAESSELFQLRSVHNRKDELSSLFLSTPDSVTLCCWLKCKLSTPTALARTRAGSLPASCSGCVWPGPACSAARWTSARRGQG